MTEENTREDEDRAEALRFAAQASLGAFMEMRKGVVEDEIALADKWGLLLPEDHQFLIDKFAFCFCLTIKPDSGEIPEFEVLANHPDIYHMLEVLPRQLAVAQKIANGFVFGTFTQGWGAPVEKDDDDDIPPSESPNRKRVMLVHMISAFGEQTTAMKLEDVEEIMTQTGNAGGNLSDALINCAVVASQTFAQLN